MKIKEGFIVKEIAGKNVVVTTGDEALNFNMIMHLNDSAKLLFEKLKQGSSEEELVELLMDHYDVGLEVATRDVKGFIQVLIDKNII
ncbi:MAG: PqqD family protein [Acholeplasmataceae bacterium]|nr:PqqD family protein [Acholeplasmataceae bacterium]